LAMSLTLTPNEAERHGIHVNHDGVRRSAFDLLSRAGIGIPELTRVWPELGALDRFVSEQIEIEAKYAVYLQRQDADIDSIRRDDGIVIPADFSYAEMPGLSLELRDKLSTVRPANLGQAGRIEGMTPAALALVLGQVRRHPGRKVA
jgi:tRNA uridine 5-carboxymethylaminomethyl modification enzyme